MRVRARRPSLRRLVPAACLAGTVLLGVAGPARAQVGERIHSYRVEVAVQPNGSLIVTERIEYDFDGLDRHGIFRDIPVRFTYDERYDRVFPVDVLSVQGSPGTPDQFETEEEGSLLRIRIGDPDRTISGLHMYTITYRVRGALNGFRDHDELYWNAVGPYWDVPITDVVATVTSPAEITRVTCFAGPLGSTLPCERGRVRSATATFRQSLLQPREGLTVVAGFPTGAVPTPTPILEERWSLQRAFSVAPLPLGLLGVIVLGVAAGLGWLLWISGRDRRAVGSPVEAAFPSGRGPEQRVPLFEPGGVPVEYAPPEGVRPGQVGTIVDEAANPLDVTATIVDLAVRGYLRIEEIPKRWIFGKPDWRIVKLKVADDDLLRYERLLLDGLFEEPDHEEGWAPATGPALGMVRLSSLRKVFAQRLRKVQDALYDDAMKRKWFAVRPDRVRQTWQGRGWLLFLAGAGLTWLAAAKSHLGLVPIPLALAGLILVWGARWMPRRTAKGTGLVRRVLGFRTYIERAEVDEARFAERANLFSRYLPFAVVFGCTEKWAGAFADLEGTIPGLSWYVGGDGFTVRSFSDRLDGFSVASSGTIASTPAASGSSGFGGGGFSGGGGGGGGGGSW